MTVVIGRRFGETIVLLSDTMISDANTGRSNGIPGRLKSIILADRLSIAYAGHSDPALRAIREASCILIRDGYPAVLKALCKHTASRDHDVDFIVASHLPSTELRRVWDGNISNSLDQTCIGNCVIVPEVLKRFSQSGKAEIDASEFCWAFLHAFTDRRVFAGTGVGGFPTVLVARPDGHAYRGHMLNETWKPIGFGPSRTTFEDENDLLTGEWSFRHDVLAPKQPGLAALGVEVLQAKIGFIYAPLVEDDPVRITLLGQDKKWTQNQSKMHAVMHTALDAKIAEIQGTPRVRTAE